MTTMDETNIVNINSLLDVSSVPGVNNDVLDAEVETYEPVKLPEVHSNPEHPSVDFSSDYSHVRKSMIQRSELGMDLLQDMINSAKQTENPKYVMAAVELMKEIGSVDRDIIKFHDSIQKIRKDKEPKAVSSATQEGVSVVYAQTAASPNSLLEDDQKEKEAIEEAEYNEIK